MHEHCSLQLLCNRAERGDLGISRSTLFSYIILFKQYENGEHYHSWYNCIIFQDDSLNHRHRWKATPMLAQVSFVLFNFNLFYWFDWSDQPNFVCSLFQFGISLSPLFSSRSCSGLLLPHAWVDSGHAPCTHRHSARRQGRQSSELCRSSESTGWTYYSLPGAEHNGFFSFFPQSI